ncbi:MAG: hypothetical protein DK303_001526 [Chloroflexi bacterium]|nr:MAG: hypothetical protein DK303_001526 [Chloroflexota bacterium]
MFMYGTIFNLDVKEGCEQELMANFDKLENPPGAVAFFLMKPDKMNSELIGVAVFESRDAYVKNANRPEQHQNFTNMMQYLTSEPAWNDGEYLIGKVS